MVSKKFLCAAPSSHSWEERAQNLLRSLGGDKKKRERIVRHTLEALKNHVEEKQRTGPGRKSHSENAMAFYRYVLSMSEAKGEEEKGDNEKPNEEQSSMNSQEFLDQHNDLCEVCNEGGELLCCSTCNLVFHMKCHRPEVKSEPADDWSCSYCISSGLTGYKREARPRKRALNGARDMTRAKEEREESTKKAKAESNAKAPDGLTKKTSTPATEEEKDGEGDEKEGTRAKRTRKAPVLYMPQQGADSKWKTDGHHEWGTVSRSERKQKKSDDGKKDGKKREDGGDDPEEPVWCNFCKDDSKVLLCCFCACRVCFGKHDGAHLLICDSCETEYHTYCLDPPLSSVPKKRKWFCPSCKKKDRPESPRKPRAASSASKRSPTLTPPRRSASGGSESTAERSSSRSRTKPARFNSPANVPSKSAAAKALTQTPPPKKRGPGRPRKHPLPEDRPTPTPKRAKSDAKSSDAKQKRSSSRDSKGNSRESKKDTESSSSRSRSLSSQAVAFVSSVTKSITTSLAKSKSQTATSTPLQHSQSGRQLKRKAFHDEIEEGEQHLKSNRSQLPSGSVVGPPAKKAALAAPPNKVAPPLAVASSVPVPLLGGGSSATVKLPVSLPIPKPVPPPKSGVPSTGTAVFAPATPAAALPAKKAAVPMSAVLPATPASLPQASPASVSSGAAPAKVPRRKPGARECMQISRRFGVQVIPQKYMDILLDYCSRGKVEHLIRMRERLDDHARFLEMQLAGLEALVKEKGESDLVVPAVVEAEQPYQSPGAATGPASIRPAAR